MSIIERLKEVWFAPIYKEQREYRKNHILDKYHPDGDWKDDPFW